MTVTDQAVDAIATLAQEAAQAEELEPGKFYAFRIGGQVHKIDLTGDQYRDQPKRKRGVTTVRDVDSFLSLWSKHSDVDSEIYADRDGLAITGVLNADRQVVDDADGAGARWRDHRVVLALKHSEAFTAWKDINGRPLSQTAFAEFIEDHRSDVREPAAADLLELAQDFQATSKVTFRSGSRLQSGQRTLTYVEQIDATAGHDGKLTIPEELQLGLAVFEGAAMAERVTARLRYRIDSGGKLALIVVLDQLADVIAAAFEGVIKEVDEGVAVPILRGTPA